MVSHVPAMLISTTLTSPGVVKFDINPEKVTLSRDVVQRNRGTTSAGQPGGATGSIFRRANPTKIVLSDMIFYGEDTKPRCDLLMNWMSPSGGLLGAIAGAAVSALSGGLVNLSTSTPTLTFNWGPPVVGFVYDCKLTKATIEYTRFNDTGIPIRAKVGITLQEQPSLLSLLGTNPTSGGLPDRRSHEMLDGENLQGVATANYGSPAHWRGVAEANKIDDPMRMRPGQQVLLPNGSELSDPRPGR